MSDDNNQNSNGPIFTSALAQIVQALNLKDLIKNNLATFIALGSMWIFYQGMATYSDKIVSSINEMKLEVSKLIIVIQELESLHKECINQLKKGNM